jgi:hypothetical protein
MQQRTGEFWAAVKKTVEQGASLKETAKWYKISYSNLSQRAAAGGWKLSNRGRPRTKEYPSKERQEEIAKLEREREERLKAEAETITIDISKAENLTRRVLATHSGKLKVLLSELALRTAEELREQDVKPREKALAIQALKNVGESLFGWRAETPIIEEESANHPLHGAVNLRLISTSPAALRLMGEGRKEGDAG